MVRRNITLPESLAARLEAIKKARAKVSDGEAIGEMIRIMEIITGKKDSDLFFRDRTTGQETIIKIPE